MNFVCNCLYCVWLYIICAQSCSYVIFHLVIVSKIFLYVFHAPHCYILEDSCNFFKILSSPSLVPSTSVVKVRAKEGSALNNS